MAGRLFEQLTSQDLLGSATSGSVICCRHLLLGSVTSGSLISSYVIHRSVISGSVILISIAHVEAGFLEDSCSRAWFLSLVTPAMTDVQVQGILAHHPCLVADSLIWKPSSTSRARAWLAEQLAVQLVLMSTGLLMPATVNHAALLSDPLATLIALVYYSPFLDSSTLSVLSTLHAMDGLLAQLRAQDVVIAGSQGTSMV